MRIHISRWLSSEKYGSAAHLNLFSVTEIVPPFVASRIRKQASFTEVSAYSTPVPFFGNIETARVATLSLNPSHDEFYKGQRLLTEPYERRLESLASLGAESLEQLSDVQVEAVYHGCLNYYRPDGRAYKRWFGPMETLLNESLGLSYKDGTCCHTDVIQWATNPKWQSMKPEVINAMLVTDLPFLKTLLSFYNIRLILMNGVTAVNYFRTLFADEITGQQEYYPNGGTKGLRLFTGTMNIGGQSGKYFGWNRYIQRGCKPSDRETLYGELRTYVADIITT